MDGKELGALLWEHPEPGFYEVETHKILSEAFTSRGFVLEEFKDFPGFIATVDGEMETKRIYVIADMDALPNPQDAEGRYIHSCGHHQQMAVLYEAARLLQDQDPEVLKSLAFVAVPGEEYIDFPLRRKLQEEGKITFLSGKLELLHRGVFDKPDFVIATHSAGKEVPVFINSVRKMSGFKVMSFHFTGRSSHAGAQPHRGINAQNAASLFLQAAAFLRESFDEEDHIRIHPILKLAPDQSVNLIPAVATVETFVRGEISTPSTKRLINSATPPRGAPGPSGPKWKYKSKRDTPPSRSAWNFTAWRKKPRIKWGFPSPRKSSPPPAPT